MTLVVKLGGSLNRDPLLREWLQLLAEHGGGRVVIVAGGGRFADQVREHQMQLGFDDLTAHNMAVLAMVQSAMLVQGLAPWRLVIAPGRPGLAPRGPGLASRSLCLATTPADIRRVLLRGEVAVWSPFDWIRQAADDMTHWGTTSDSLAAWLAGQLDAAVLVLVKSCPIEAGASLGQYADQGVVDETFCRVTAGAGYGIELLGKTELARMHDLLSAPETDASGAR